ncbi:MAG: gliding motility-associated C-terminal domain-containing protein [Cytophagales bacterium]|nr:gliding motility-associated C-terminal domain-containing protein [Cytophagales bacterium]
MMKKITLLEFWRHLFIKSCLTLFLFALLISDLEASHIRAGEIIATRIDPFERTYEFTFIGYRDDLTSVRFGNGIFRFGDGEIEEIPTIFNEVQIRENLFRVEFRLVHTYRGNGAYTVSYEEEYRNRGIANMNDSGNTLFYVESQIVIDGLVGLNSTPRFTYPPIDDGTIGLAYHHNPVAFDPDDDSLSYELVTPQQARGMSVTNYRLPNAPEFYVDIPFFDGNEGGGSEPSFSIDQDGNLIWDAPGDFLNLAGGNECPPGVERCAEYNVAFKVTEWKKLGAEYVPYGYVIRDMQITISEGDNTPPELKFPADICVEAGTNISEIISATDVDGHQVELSAFGAPFQVPGPATVSPFPFEYQDSPAEMTFAWNTLCGHVKGSPYIVGFRANDLPEEDGERVGPSLSDVGFWSITVVGPAPQGLVLQNNQEGISVDWESYFCSNADNIQVWRRIGPYAFEPDECEVGIPEGAGYRLVGQVTGTENSFFDQSNVAAGALYCYRLVASFPQEGISYASEEVCITVPLNTPIITNVDVANTSVTDGEIIVKWLPSETDNGSFHKVLRFDNLNGKGTPVEVASGLTQLEFVDQGLNTDRNQYSYQVLSGTDSATVASQVHLDLQPGIEQIELTWVANVPWTNQSQRFPYHYVYRNQINEADPDQVVLVDSIRADLVQLQYLDNGAIGNTPLQSDSTYCYFVTTQGTYENSPGLPEPLLNRSQLACSKPNDITPPCEPSFPQIVNLKSCEENPLFATCPNEYFNELTWDMGAEAEGCDEEVRLYNVYFSQSGLVNEYEVVATVNTNAFIHQDLSSFKGCYRISAVDRSGNESELSEEVCNDNCSSLELPNVFTPNSDGKNDTFIPFASFIEDNESRDEFCDLFIDRVEFQVFDRTGKEVFAMNSDNPENSKFIQWDGRSNNGNSLPTGIYYYQANVQFDVLASSESHKIFNGWVQILK